MAYRYQYPQQQPYFLYQPQQQMSSGIIWVSSEQEAMGYMVLPNTAVTLWDSSAPVVYLKQADASGKPSMRVYDLVERKAEPEARAEYVSLQDFNDLKARVDALVKGAEG